MYVSGIRLIQLPGLLPSGVVHTLFALAGCIPDRLVCYLEQTFVRGVLICMIRLSDVVAGKRRDSLRKL